LEEAAVLLVVEELDREPGKPVRLLEPAQLAGRGVQLEQAVGGVCVILEVAAALRDTVAPGAVKPPVAGRKRAEQERAERPARRDPVGAVEHAAAFGEGGK